MLPDGEGFELVKDLAHGSKRIPVVIITAHADKDLAINALNYGIFKFLEKPVSKEKIIEVLQDCLILSNRANERNKLEYSHKVLPHAIKKLSRDFSISSREIEIIELALNFHTNRPIAEKLFISEGTVKRHMHNIFEKLQIEYREQLQKLITNLNNET